MLSSIRKQQCLAYYKWSRTVATTKTPARLRCGLMFLCTVNSCWSLRWVWDGEISAATGPEEAGWRFTAARELRGIQQRIAIWQVTPPSAPILLVLCSLVHSNIVLCAMEPIQSSVWTSLRQDVACRHSHRVKDLYLHVTGFASCRRRCCMNGTRFDWIRQRTKGEKQLEFRVLL